MKDDPLLKLVQNSGFEFYKNNNLFDGRAENVSSSIRLLKNVIKSQKLKKNFGLNFNLVLKTINSIYKAFFKIYLKNEKGTRHPWQWLKKESILSLNLHNKPNFIEFVYEFYLKNFGMISISERKLIIFLTSIQKNQSHPKVNMFAQFIGLIPNEEFIIEELIFYLKSFSFLLERNTNFNRRADLLRTNDKTGEMVLKNPKLNPFLSQIESVANKIEFKRFRRELDAEIQKVRKDKFVNIDNVIKSAILFRRAMHKPLPVIRQIFNAFRYAPENIIYPLVFKLLTKHFMNKKLQKYTQDQLLFRSPLNFKTFLCVIESILTEYDLDNSKELNNSILSRNDHDSSPSIFGSSKCFSINLQIAKGEQPRKSLNENVSISVQSKEDSNNLRFFNTDKISRAKLNREGFELKVYFQQHQSELKNEMLKSFKRINYVDSEFAPAVKFIFWKLAQKFDLFTFWDVDEFFILWYLIKKEVH